MSTKHTPGPPIPSTRRHIDALPYVISWEPWGITAWHKAINEQPPRYRKLAEVQFPVSACGPFAPEDMKHRKFAELDAAARDTLDAHEHACSANYFARARCTCAEILPRLINEATGGAS